MWVFSLEFIISYFDSHLDFWASIKASTSRTTKDKITHCKQDRLWYYRELGSNLFPLISEYWIFENFLNTTQIQFPQDFYFCIFVLGEGNLSIS